MLILRKGRQQELQARLLEADRNREELQRVRDEMQMSLSWFWDVTDVTWSKAVSGCQETSIYVNLFLEPSHDNSW